MVNTAAAYKITGLTHTVPSGADLSALQYTAIRLDTDGKAVTATAATHIGIGILMNNPNAADMEAVYASQCIHPAIAGGAFNEGDRLVCGTGGKLVASTTANDWIVGIAMGASTGDGHVVPVRVGPFGFI